MRQRPLPRRTRIRLVRPVGGYPAGTEGDVVQAYGASHYEVDFCDGTGTRVVPQVHAVEVEPPLTLWQEIRWQTSAFFWALGVLLRASWRRRTSGLPDKD